MNKIVLGLPKGSLEKATIGMMSKAGFNISGGSRTYAPRVDDPLVEARLIRAQEISRYVELGVLDAGITGHDWIVENNSDVDEIAELVYSKQEFRPVRWVLAVPNDSPVKSVGDIQDKRIATEAVGLTRAFLEKEGVEASVEFSWGATEAKAPELVDAIVDVTETGSSLRANNLRIVATVLESTTRLIACKESMQDPGKKAKIEQISILLKGALGAENTVLLKMNARKNALENITGMLPSLHAPTINMLSADEWVAIETVVLESEVSELIPKLKKAGAKVIIELPLNKVIA